MLFLALIWGACAQCPSDYYYDTTRDDCFACAADCSSCAAGPDDVSSNCISCCDPMQEVLDGNCYYPCEITNNCNVCGFECQNCTSTACTQCFPPYYLLNPSCALLCPSDYYLNETECIPCDISCEACTGGSNFNCTSCSSAYELYQGACVLPFCGDGIVSNGEECDDPADPYCVDCKIVGCTTGYYLLNSACLACDPSCDGCSGGTSAECVACASGYILYGGVCLLPFCGDGIVTAGEQCDDAIDANCYNCQWISCEHGMYLSNGTCLMCDESCNGCVGGNSSDCIQCSSQYYNYKGACVLEQCGDGLLAPGEICEDSLDDNCFNCTFVNCIPPGMVSSWYTEDFEALVITFNSTISQINCSAFANVEILGRNPQCSSNNTAITILFGDYPSMNFRDALIVKKQALSECGDETSIDPSGSHPSFTFDLVGSNFLGACSDSLSLSMFLKNSYNRPMYSFNWTLQPPNPAIDGYLSTLSPTIPAYLLLGEVYTFELSATNFLGDTASSSLTVNSSLYPAPVISDPIVSEVTSKDVVFIRADATMCSSTDQIFFDWELLSTPTVPIEKFGRILKLNKSSLDVGDHVDLRIWAWTETSVKSYRDMHIQYAASDIQALIHPRCVSTMRKSYEFDGSRSTYSNSNADLNYNWKLLYNREEISNSQSSKFNMEVNEKGLYLLELEVSRFGISAVDRIEIRVGEEESYTTASTLRLYTDHFALFSKTNNTARWSSNLSTPSNLQRNRVRFFNSVGKTSGWVTINGKCKEYLTLPAAPRGGILKVLPGTGIAWNTQFNLIAEDWINAYYYQFWYSVGGDFFPLTDKIFQNSLTTGLPFSKILTVKLRVFSMLGSYTDLLVNIEIAENDENPLYIFLDTNNNIPAMHYEKMIQNAMVLLPLFDEIIISETNECHCVHGICENSLCVCNNGYRGPFCLDSSTEKLSSLNSKLFDIGILASKNLPSNEYLDLMILMLLSDLLKHKHFLTIEMVRAAAKIIEKRSNCWNNTNIAQHFVEISSVIFEYSNTQSENNEFQSELETSLSLIGHRFGKLMADEPPFVIFSKSIALQASNIFSSYSSNKDPSPNSSLSQASQFKITTPSPLDITIINFFLHIPNSPSDKSIVVVSLSLNTTVDGYVSMPTSSNSTQFCTTSYNESFPAMQISSNYWCRFTGSEKLHLEVDLTSYASRYSLEAIWWVLAVAAVDALWIAWGFWKDKRDRKTSCIEMYTSTTLFKAILNCHHIISTFYRYDRHLSRISRIVIINVKVSVLCVSVISLANYFENYVQAMISVTVSYISVIILRSLLISPKTVERVAPEEPPIYRYSPTIKLPEISTQVKYSHVRNESNRDTVQEAKSAVNRNKKIIMVIRQSTGWNIWLGVIGYCSYLIVVSEPNWWKVFCYCLAFDVLILQGLSIVIQFYLFRRSSFLSRFVSRTIKEITETSVVIING